MPIFILSFFFLLVFVLVFYRKEAIRSIAENIQLKVFLILTVIISFYYGLFYILPAMGFIEGQSRLLLSPVWWYYGNAFLFWQDVISPTPWLRMFYSPWYFSLFLILSPLFLAYKRQWILLVVNFCIIFFGAIVFLGPYIDARLVVPFIMILIPQVAFAIYLLLGKIGLSQKKILLILFVVIGISFFQNWEFLNTTTSHKHEQEFLRRHFQETIPENSLFLTVHNGFFRDSGLEKTGKEYINSFPGLEFPIHLVPQDRGIVVMDILREYNEEIVREHDNVFYYRSLNAYHEKDYYKTQDMRAEAIWHPDGYTPYEATEIFENNHKLELIEGKDVKNYGLDASLVEHFKRGRNVKVYYEGVIPIGLYRVEKDEAE